MRKMIILYVILVNTYLCMFVWSCIFCTCVRSYVHVCMCVCMYEFVCVCVSVYVCAYMRGCGCLFVWASIARWSGNRPSNPKVVGLIPSCGHSDIIDVSLNKKLYSHCSSPPSCNISGYLVITGEANIKLLSMSTNRCGPGGTLGAHTITLSMVRPHLWSISPPPGGFASTGL